jgi:hypothetical protein
VTDDAAARHKVENAYDGFKELEMVVYVGDFKVVGVAHFGVGQRISSRRASDYIRQIQDNRLTLSKVRIYSKSTQDLIETTPFVLINMDKIDFMFAREDAGPEPA